MRTKGRRSPAYENLVRTKYAGFTVHYKFVPVAAVLNHADGGYNSVMNSCSDRFFFFFLLVVVSVKIWKASTKTGQSSGLQSFWMFNEVYVHVTLLLNGVRGGGGGAVFYVLSSLWV